jgi:type I restriction enzyme R subunit
VFNLLRGLQKDIDDDPNAAPVLQPLKDRADRILKDLEDRKVTGLAAMDLFAALAAQRDAASQAAKDSGLSPKAFGVFWVLRETSSGQRRSNPWTSRRKSRSCLLVSRTRV